MPEITNSEQSLQRVRDVDPFPKKRNPGSRASPASPVLGRKDSVASALHIRPADGQSTLAVSHGLSAATAASDAPLGRRELKSASGSGCNRQHCPARGRPHIPTRQPARFEKALSSPQTYWQSGIASQVASDTSSQLECWPGMDPVSILSIVSASASIATAAGKAARQIDDLRVKYNEAPENLRLLGTNLRTVEAIIINLHEKYDRGGVKLPERQLRLLDDNLYSCTRVVSRLQVYLDKVQSTLGPVPSLTTRQKIRYLFSDANIRQYQDQLFQQTQILNVYAQQLEYASPQGIHSVSLTLQQRPNPNRGTGRRS